MNTRKPNTNQRVQLSNNERIVQRTNLRRRKNKRKKLIIRMVLGLTIFIVGTVLALTLFFNINTIKVTGDTVYAATNIIEVSEVAEGDNLIFLSEKKINEKITKELAYVSSVNIKRRLPSTLEIVITKANPYMAIMSDGYYTLLDNSGKVLEQGLETVGDNIIIVNLGEIESAKLGETIVLKNEKIHSKIKDLIDELENLNFKEITNIDLSDIHNIKVVYQGRITLELGETSKDALGSKLALGQAAIEKQNEENELYRGTINLTVEGKGYWSEEVSTTAPAVAPEPVENEEKQEKPQEETTKKEE